MSGAVRALAWIGAAALAGSAAAPAAAQDVAPPPVEPAHRRLAAVEVRLDPCLDAEHAETFLDALRVELRETADAVTTAPAPLGAGGARVAIGAGPGCDATRLDVRAWSGPDAIVPNVERRLDLAATPDAQRPRVVAITAAEVLRSALDDPERDARQLELLPPRPVSPPAPAPPPPAPARPRHRLLAGIAARGSFEPAAIHLGPRLDARIAATSWLDATATASAVFTGEATPLGDVATRALLGRVGAAFARREAHHQLDVGPFLELGAAQIAADAAGRGVIARDASGPIAGVGVAAGVELEPVAPLRARIDLELGTALLGVEGDVEGRAVPGYSGPFAAGGVAVGLGF